MSKISDTTKTVIIASMLLIATCLGWFFFIYQPKVSKVESIREQTQDILFKLQSLRVTQEQVGSLENQVKLIRKEIELTKQKIISKEDLQESINQMRKMGHRFGLKFDKIIPDYPSLIGSEEEKSNSEVLKLTIHLKLQGYYKNFGDFLSSLNKLPFYVSLGEMTLVYNHLIHPEIDILVDLIVYVRPEAGVTS